MYFYKGPPNWVFPVFSFLGMVLALVPLPWHLKALNVGTSMCMLWVALGCLVFFVDSIVWRGNVIDWSPTWCDISTHYATGFNLAAPATSLCINRRLYLIATTRRGGGVTKTRAERRREIITDLAITLGLPILQIALQYIVQGHRYDIFEDIGCLSETYTTPVAIALFYVPPILCGCVSGVYCIRSIYAFYKARAYFKEVLSMNSDLNLNTYFRLMVLASMDLLCTIPIASWALHANISGGISPWISWADTHSNFSRVGQFPGAVWRTDRQAALAVEESRWIGVACAYLIFFFFGFGEEAKKNYLAAYTAVARRVGYAGGVLPTFSKPTASSLKFAESEGAIPEDEDDGASSRRISVQIQIPPSAQVKATALVLEVPVSATQMV
ncbi:pheromone A receptor-domain-containing protein [Mycena pura]|uniref:Pheromone A receptor-domain-containing protein n=1 Tax=Mycena pura TaxID=153505 RepID=A0AAD6YEH9_9AGAR|nr:pheromone A receptor-domain-containing protein [Mycena pura]